MGTLLEVKHLKKYFNSPKGKVHAVDDVTFKIDEETDYCTDCQSKLILCGNCNERAIFIENKCSNCGAVVTD
mgnify:CR=1 FL=1